MALIPRRAEEHHDYWRNAIVLGCLAADELGRTSEMRAAIEGVNALPRDLTPAGFAGWVGPSGSAEVRLRDVVALRRCVFTAAAADAPRRSQLRAIFAQIEGADWETSDEWQGIAAELTNDREAIIAYYLPRDTAVSNLPLREGTARMLGGADDPRVIAHFAEQHVRVAQMRAALPAALAKEGLSMLPEQKH